MKLQFNLSKPQFLEILRLQCSVVSFWRQDEHDLQDKELSRVTKRIMKGSVREGVSPFGLGLVKRWHR